MHLHIWNQNFHWDYYFLELNLLVPLMFLMIHMFWGQNTMLLNGFINYNYMFKFTCLEAMLNWFEGLDLKKGKVKCLMCLSQSFTLVKIMPIGISTSPSMGHVSHNIMLTRGGLSSSRLDVSGMMLEAIASIYQDPLFSTIKMATLI